MTFSDIASLLHEWAPPSLAESYDNPGLIVGIPSTHCTGVLVSLDCTEAVIEEAKKKGCNLVVSHHPIWFGSRKKLNGEDYVSRTIMKAVKEDIGIFAIHTNLDNVQSGVNAMICERLGLKNYRILDPKKGNLKKLVVFVPHPNREAVLEALWAAGAGKIGNYDQAAFWTTGTGSFRPLEGANPAIGSVGDREYVEESRVEVIFQVQREKALLQALKSAHPYEEVAFYLSDAGTDDRETGSGMVGEFDNPLKKKDFLDLIREKFKAGIVRYADCAQEEIKRVAVCGGSGSFLISNALRVKADAFVTGDLTYHKFFDGEGRMMIADIGHGESEQFTGEWICRYLSGKNPSFAVLLSDTQTNPLKYH